MLEGSALRYIIQVSRPYLRAAGLLKWKRRTDSSRLTLWIMFPGEISNINNPGANNLLQKGNFCPCSMFHQDPGLYLSTKALLSWLRCTATEIASASSVPVCLNHPQWRPRYLIAGNTENILVCECLPPRNWRSLLCLYYILHMMSWYDVDEFQMKP